MRRERALWLASVGISVVITGVGIVLIVSGGWLWERYEFAATKCAHGPLHIPGLSGELITVDSRGTGLECNGAAQRAALGNWVEGIGILFIVVAVVFLVVVLLRRPRLRAGTAHPVARQSRPLGALLIGFGRAVMIAGAIGFVLLLVGVVASTTPFRAVYTSQPGDTDYRADQVSIDWAYIALYLGLIAVAVVLALTGRNATRRGRRHLQASAQELRAEDPRPPVVYLRSFAADEVMAASRGLGDSAEEALVAALSVLGPVVALGEPGEKLPPLGAARAYTPNERWQLHISDWTQEARQVVLLAGDTPSFWWEVRHLVAAEALGKAVFLLPGGADYRSFRDRFTRETRIPLPAELPGTGTQFAVAGILRFGARGPSVEVLRPGTMTRTRWMEVLVPAGTTHG